jgi:hypothetical protein
LITAPAFYTDHASEAKARSRRGRCDMQQTGEARHCLKLNTVGNTEVTP